MAIQVEECVKKRVIRALVEKTAEGRPRFSVSQVARNTGVTRVTVHAIARVALLRAWDRLGTDLTEGLFHD
jgi:hypothetical protein